jgi:hypothetical protein
MIIRGWIVDTNLVRQFEFVDIVLDAKLQPIIRTARIMHSMPEDNNALLPTNINELILTLFGLKY